MNSIGAALVPHEYRAMRTAELPGIAVQMTTSYYA